MFELVKGVEATLQDRLNGAVLIGPFPAPIGGLTFVLSSPASGTATFDGTVGAPVSASAFMVTLADTFAGIMLDLRPVVAGVGTRHYVALWSPTGITVDAGGSANTHVGLSGVADTVSAGPIDPAKIIGFSLGATNGYYVLMLSTIAKV